MAILPCDYYVRPINGNDSNDGTEFETKAFKSLQKALDTVTATAGQIKKVGLVCEGDEIITARIDDDTNMIPAAAAVNFLSLNADGSYETNPTLRPTYWISANGIAITNTDMFQTAVAGNNNKYFENIGFKNCLRDSVSLSTGIFGMSFGVLSCKNIGRYALVCATTGTNNYIDFLFVDGCVQAVNGTTTGVIHIKRCFVLNASGLALQSGSAFTYGEIYLSSCANGLRFIAKLKVDRIYADNVAGYVFAQAGTNISNVIDRVRAINCGSIFKPEAAGNMITCRMLYKYNVTNDTDPTALGVTNIVNSVTMSSSGKAGVAGDGNLTLLESAEYRRIAIPLDANNTYYQETGLPGPDYMRPRITGISDPTADVAGGTVRVITGAGFTGATAVTIGGTAATSFTVDSDTQITATLPAKTAGVYDVAVTVGGVTWTESGLVKYQGAGIPLPSKPVLTSTATSKSKVLHSWAYSTLVATYLLERSENETDWTTVPVTTYGPVFEETGLTADTLYYYRLTASNDSGSTVSDTVHTRTWKEAETPDETIVSDLAKNIRLAILDITESGTEIFTTDNVVIGRIFNHDSDRTYPCCEIYPAGRGAAGDTYESQREVACNYAFEIWAYEKIAEGSESREDGDDMESVSKIGSAIIRQMFSFLDKKTDTYPCKGFLWTNPSFTEQPVYELINYGINSVGIQVSFRVDTVDTEL